MLNACSIEHWLSWPDAHACFEGWSLWRALVTQGQNGFQKPRQVHDSFHFLEEIF